MLGHHPNQVHRPPRPILYSTLPSRTPSHLQLASIFLPFGHQKPRGRTSVDFIPSDTKPSLLRSAGVHLCPFALVLISVVLVSSCSVRNSKLTSVFAPRYSPTAHLLCHFDISTFRLFVLNFELACRQPRSTMSCETGDREASGRYLYRRTAALIFKESSSSFGASHLKKIK